MTSLAQVRLGARSSVQIENNGGKHNPLRQNGQTRRLLADHPRLSGS